MKRKLIACSTIMVLLFSLSIVNVGAHTVVVDGRRADWFSTVSGTGVVVNHGFVARNASQQGEFIWRDAEIDHRIITDTNTVTDVVDLTWFHVTADATNLYLLLRVQDNPVGYDNFTGVKRPEFQVAIDRGAGANNSGLVNAGGTTVGSNAAWEFLIRTNFQSNVEAAPLLYTSTAGPGTATGAGSLKKASDDLAELRIPWSQIGGPPVSPNNRLRFSVAVFYIDRSAPADGLASTVIDTLSPTQNTAGDLGNNILDHYVDVSFALNGEVMAPLQITEFLPNPSGGTEWIEIYNPNSPGSPAIPLSQYKVGDSASRDPGGSDGMFRFPTSGNPTISAGGVVIVAKDQVQFTAQYGVLPGVTVYGIDATGPTSTRMIHYPQWGNDTSIELKDALAGAETNFSEQVVLLDERDSIVDMATYSTNGQIFFAHTPIPVTSPIPAGISYERCPATVDTNDSQHDFLINDPANPQLLPPSPGVVCTAIATADLDITKAGPSEVVPGSNITYTLTLKNVGAVASTNVVVTDTLPSGVSFVSQQSTLPPGTFNNTNGVLVWTFPTVGQITETITLVGQINANVGSEPLTNTVSISGSGETNTLNNNDSVTSTPIRPDLQLEKSGPSSLRPGETFTYTLTYSNNGQADATNVTITDVLPAGLSFVSQSAPPGVTFGQSGNTLTWTLASLAADDTGTIALQVRLNTTGLQSGQTIDNTATISGTPNGPTGTSGDSDQSSLVVNFFKVYMPLVTK